MELKMKALLLLFFLCIGASANAAEIACPDPAYPVGPYSRYSQRCYDLGTLDAMSNPIAQCAAFTSGVRRTGGTAYVQSSCYFRVAEHSNIQVRDAVTVIGKNASASASAFIAGQPAPQVFGDHDLYPNISPGVTYKLVLLTYSYWIGSGYMSATASVTVGN
jgi:hypothetical protein